MATKRQVLDTLRRPALAKLVADLDLKPENRRAKAKLIDCLVAARRIRLDDVLGRLTVAELRNVAAALGIEPIPKQKAKLVEALSGGRAKLFAAPKTKRATAGAEPKASAKKRPAARTITASTPAPTTVLSEPEPKPKPTAPRPAAASGERRQPRRLHRAQGKSQPAPPAPKEVSEARESKPSAAASQEAESSGPADPRQPRSSTRAPTNDPRRRAPEDREARRKHERRPRRDHDRGRGPQQGQPDSAPRVASPDAVRQPVHLREVGIRWGQAENEVKAALSRRFTFVAERQSDHGATVEQEYSGHFAGFPAQSVAAAFYRGRLFALSVLFADESGESAVELWLDVMAKMIVTYGKPASTRQPASLRANTREACVAADEAIAKRRESLAAEWVLRDSEARLSVLAAHERDEEGAGSVRVGCLFTHDEILRRWRSDIGARGQ